MYIPHIVVMVNSSRLKVNYIFTHWRIYQFINFIYLNMKRGKYLSQGLLLKLFINPNLLKLLHNITLFSYHILVKFNIYSNVFRARTQ